MNNRQKIERQRLIESICIYIYTLQDAIGRGLISTRSHWKNLDDDDIEFPELDLDILRSLFFGIYQIKQSKTYTEEHLDENGKEMCQFVDLAAQKIWT